ncbi:hypothetical protein PsYK624_049850 [Phanerochaete sordida]|uniref:Uncharacterized protein n=1 Tax=Phanerochaete sordida TaxID=48140 RepID=A0A9P3G4B4_9APHY|nr:hypothetical protein PsYK624_049850 [Phanerochaete sordida]
MQLTNILAFTALFGLALACTPGQYFCGPHTDGTAGSAVYVCDSAGEPELVASCGSAACLEPPSQPGVAYCES